MYCLSPPMAEPPEGEGRGGRDMGWVGWNVVFLVAEPMCSGWGQVGGALFMGWSLILSHGFPRRELELPPLSSALERKGLCLHHPDLGLALLLQDLWVVLSSASWSSWLFPPGVPRGRDRVKPRGRPGCSPSASGMLPCGWGGPAGSLLSPLFIP